MRHPARSALLLLCALLVATAASAELYTVTLKNGTSFETRYRPIDAEWSDDVLMMVTDRGNWIALDKVDVAEVASRAETSGFGYQLDTTTLFLGWSPNDLVTENENGELVPSYDVDGALPAPGSDSGAGGGYSIDQFVNTPIVGSDGGGGIPLFVSSGEATQ